MEFVFVAETHEEYGLLGWRLKSQPDFDPLLGMAVAHDCLEHFSDSPNPADEFMALGASLFVRDYNYYLQLGEFELRPGARISSDVPDILRHIKYEGYSFPAAPRTCKCDEEVEEQIAIMFAEFSKNLDDDDKELWPDATTARSITSYLRIGYRKAVRRYRGRSWEARKLFRAIELGADKALTYSEGSGEELVVRVNFKDLTHKLFIRYPQDEY